MHEQTEELDLTDQLSSLNPQEADYAACLDQLASLKLQKVKRGREKLFNRSAFTLRANVSANVRNSKTLAGAH